MLTACAGGGGDAADPGSIDTTDGGGGGGSTNQAPTISGSPPAKAMQDIMYAFEPTASDADGDALTFSVSGLPAWASFSSRTGRVSGRPDAGDLGSHPQIQISVSDGRSSTSLASFSIDVVATAPGAATLSWESPTERTDGSALTDLAGFKIYWGMTSDDLADSVTISNPGLTSFMIENLVPATWFFAATALDSSGTESRLSNMASKNVM